MREIFGKCKHRGVRVRNGRVSAARARLLDFPQLHLARQRRSEKAAARRAGLPDEEQRRLAVMRECQRRLYEKRRLESERAEQEAIERRLVAMGQLERTETLGAQPPLPAPSRAFAGNAISGTRSEAPGFIDIPLAGGGIRRVFRW
jgi:hypothetical protein